MPVLMREHRVDSYYVEFWRLRMNVLGHIQPKLRAYLTYMVQRLLFMKSLLRPTGSIYIHCDPIVSHYMKAMMDEIFGHAHSRNEITWKRTNTHSDSGTWSRISDVILFYTARRIFTWNTPRQTHSESYVAGKYRHGDGDGRKHRLDNMTGPNQVVCGAR